MSFATAPLAVATEAQVFATVSGGDGSGLGGATSAYSAPITVAPAPLAFTTSSLAVAETAGSISLTLQRTYADAATQVTILTHGGTAVAGADYVAIVDPLTFSAYATEVTVTITILDDAEVEADETFVVSLGSSDVFDVAAAGSVTVTIVSEDIATADGGDTTPPPGTGDGTGTGDEDDPQTDVAAQSKDDEGGCQAAGSSLVSVWALLACVAMRATRRRL